MKTELQKDIELHEEIKRFEKTRNWCLYKDYEKREIAFLAGYKYANDQIKNLGESSSRLSVVSGCDEGWISCEDRLPDPKENLKYDVWHIKKGRLINCDFCVRDDSSSEKYFRTNISNVVLTLNFITFWRPAPNSPHHGR